jgi:Lon protease-like protein
MLLPHGRMPLNIFEPRYLTMVIDSLKGSRLIGVVQPLVITRDSPTPDELFSIGCAGRISAFAETEDGRLMLTLRGVCRFKIEEEFNSKTLYRQVKPNFDEFKQDLFLEEPEIDRKKLIDVLAEYSNLKGIEINLHALEKATGPFLIATLAMINPFNDREKQTILETHSLSDIVEMMISLMEIELATKNQTSTRH